MSKIEENLTKGGRRPPLRRGKSADVAQLALNLDGAGAIADALDRATEELSIMMRRCKWSREELCERLGGLIGRAVSVAQLNAWTASTNRNRLPADVLVGICILLENYDPISTLLTPAGRAVASAADRAYAEIGRVAHERMRLEERERTAWSVIKNQGTHSAGSGQAPLHGSPAALPRRGVPGSRQP